MENQNVSVFVAFRNGVALALPQWATRMIRVLGAEPAEAVAVTIRQPVVVVRPRRVVSVAPVLGGQGVQIGSRRVAGRDSLERGFARQPKTSWKRYRDAQFRVAEMNA